MIQHWMIIQYVKAKAVIDCVVAVSLPLANIYGTQWHLCPHTVTFCEPPTLWFSDNVADLTMLLAHIAF